MALIPRQQILERFQDMVRRRVPIVGGGAGTGLSAKCEEAGGIDLIIIYNSGRYRMAGRGSAAGLLAYGNANEIVKEMAYEVLPVVKSTPVLAGVNGTDPFVLMPQFLSGLKSMGFSGVQNFPTIGLFDGVMRASFEETGMGYGLEVDMIRQAHELDLLTTPYVFNPGEAVAMTLPAPWDDLDEWLRPAQFLLEPAANASVLPYRDRKGQLVVYVCADGPLPDDVRVTAPGGASGNAIICSPDQSQPRVSDLNTR